MSHLLRLLNIEDFSVFPLCLISETLDFRLQVYLHKLSSLEVSLKSFTF